MRASLFRAATLVTLGCSCADAQPGQHLKAGTESRRVESGATGEGEQPTDTSADGVTFEPRTDEALIGGIHVRVDRPGLHSMQIQLTAAGSKTTFPVKRITAGTQLFLWQPASIWAKEIAGKSISDDFFQIDVNRQALCGRQSGLKVDQHPFGHVFRGDLMILTTTDKIDLIIDQIDPTNRYDKSTLEKAIDEARGCSKPLWCHSLSEVGIGGVYEREGGWAAGPGASGTIRLTNPMALGQLRQASRSDFLWQLRNVAWLPSGERDDRPAIRKVAAIASCEAAGVSRNEIESGISNPSWGWLKELISLDFEEVSEEHREKIWGEIVDDMAEDIRADELKQVKDFFCKEMQKIEQHLAHRPHPVTDRVIDHLCNREEMRRLYDASRVPVAPHL